MKKLTFFSISFILVILLLIVTCLDVSAQKKAKVVQFKDSEMIEEIKGSQNFVGVRSYDKSSKKYFAYLFDKKGTQIFQQDIPSVGFMKAEPIEFDSNQLFLVIIKGYEGGPSIKKRPDLIRVLDIKTGNQIWETEANAENYRISPNKMHVITGEYPLVDRTGPFTIIDLNTGAKQIPSKIQYYQTATWLDDDRIILASTESERPKRATDNLESELYYSKIKKISREKLSLRLKLDKGEISAEDYKTKMNVLNAKAQQLTEDFKESRKTIKPPPPRSWVKYVRLWIYNRITDNIEMEKHLFTKEGYKIIISAGDPPYGTLNVDKNKSIYVKGRYRVNDTDRGTSCLVKLDENLNLVWLTELTGVFEFNKITTPKDLYFRVRQDDEIFLIDNESGELRLTEKIPAIKGKHPAIDLKGKHIGNTVDIIENVKIDKIKNTITFYEN